MLRGSTLDVPITLVPSETPTQLVPYLRRLNITLNPTQLIPYLRLLKPALVCKLVSGAIVDTPPLVGCYRGHPTALCC